MVLDPAVIPESDAGEVMEVAHWSSAWAMLPTPTTRYPRHRLQWSVTSQASDVSTEPSQEKTPSVECTVEGEPSAVNVP